MPVDLIQSARVPAEGYPWSDRTLARMRARGTGPAYVRAAGRIFYRRRDLEAYLDSTRVLPVREQESA